MRTKLTLTSLVFAALIVSGGYVLNGNSAAAALLEARVNPHYKGASAFNLAGAGPNVARCGAFPENVELSFTGAGIDTEGGYNTAVFSACTNTLIRSRGAAFSTLTIWTIGACSTASSLA